MLADALEHLVRGLVTNPDDVSVADLERRRVRTLEVRVNPEDIRESHRTPGAHRGRVAHRDRCAGWSRAGPR